MFKRNFFENYKTTIDEITVQASKDNVESKLLKSTKNHRIYWGPRRVLEFKIEITHVTK